MDKCVCLYTHTHMHTHILIHTFTYTHVHTHIHTRAHIYSPHLRITVWAKIQTWHISMTVHRGPERRSFRDSGANTLLVGDLWAPGDSAWCGEVTLCIGQGWVGCNRDGKQIPASVPRCVALTGVSRGSVATVSAQRHGQVAASALARRPDFFRSLPLSTVRTWSWERTWRSLSYLQASVGAGFLPGGAF